MASMDRSFAYDHMNPRKASQVLRLTVDDEYHKTYIMMPTLEGGTIDLRPVHTVFLCSGFSRKRSEGFSFSV